MLDLPDMAARRKANNHAEHKAKVYGAGPHVIFFESEQYQAKEINRITGKPVLCTETFEMIFDSESVLYNMKSGKYFPGLRNLALKVRDRIRKMKNK
jgi:hypothetical protein